MEYSWYPNWGWLTSWRWPKVLHDWATWIFQIPIYIGVMPDTFGTMCPPLPVCDGLTFCCVGWCVWHQFFFVFFLYVSDKNKNKHFLNNIMSSSTAKKGYLSLSFFVSMSYILLFPPFPLSITLHCLVSFLFHYCYFIFYVQHILTSAVITLFVKSCTEICVHRLHYNI